MNRYDETMKQSELDDFIKSLGVDRFTHKDVTRCYSIYMKNNFFENFDKIKNSNNNKWTDIEINTLKEGVFELGDNNFKEILKKYSEVFGPRGRTSKDLKTKWDEIKNIY